MLPTSTASSMGRDLKQADALDALTLERRQGHPRAGAVGEREAGVELEQRNEHEAAGEDLGVRERQPLD